MGYKSYPAEYKTKVVLEVLREEKPLGEIASGYGLNPNMVRNWKTERNYAARWFASAHGAGTRVVVAGDAPNPELSRTKTAHFIAKW